jgi:hypothetical protein
LAELDIPYLESLSTGELIELAGKYDLDIPPDLDRIFIIEELLCLEPETEDVRNHEAPQQDLNHDEFLELVILPKQYNISFIEVLIRDPLWAFVFWEIKEYDWVECENEPDSGAYCLRVIPLDENSLKPNMAASFMVTLDKDEQGRYLGFPPEDGPCFKVELCMQNGEAITVLAESRPFKLPSLITGGHNAAESGSQAPYNNPLAWLSGLEHFSLIHSEDRQPRPRDIKG